MARRKYTKRRRSVSSLSRSRRGGSKKVNPFRKYGLVAGSKEFLRDLFTTKEGWKKIGIGAGIFLGLMILLAAWYAKDLPSPDKINSKLTEQSTQIFDRNGKILYEVHGNENRILVDYKEIPQSVKDATVAIEDKNFYKHHGFDVKRIFGSAIFNIRSKDKSQGGSTITQQYIKNALLSSEKSYSRKIKEFMLAIMIEQMYSKEDILKMYLNEIPYGSNAYGIQVAAKTYFEKDAKDLTLEESAVLAALPNAPTYYSPYGQHKDELMERKDMVLDLMADQKYITKEQAEEAKKKPLAFSGKVYGNITAPHFVMYVKEQLIEKYGENTVNTGGLKVYTTLDLDKQKMAEEAVAVNVDKNRQRYNASNASLVAMDPKTGQILAMVGSRDFFNEDIDGNVNVALASRQPGSSFKPYAYATMFKQDGWGAGSTLYDLKTNFGGGYSPNNYEGGFMGPMSVRKALQGSRNIPAVKALYIAGVKETIGTARDMGITTLGDSSNYGLSLVLGAGEVKLLEHTAAYGVFANGGVKQDTTPFMKIEDAEGKTLEEYKDKSGKRVLDPQVAYLITNILSDDPSRAYIFGRNGDLSLGNRPAAAKTGTTDSYKDAWTVGYTPSLVAGVWSGNNDGAPLTSAGGAIAAAPIWNDFMNKALAGTPVEQFSRPSGIKSVTLDAITGKKPTSSTRQTITDIFPSWYNIPAGGEGNEYKINPATGKLVNESCPPPEVKTITKSSLTAEIPTNDSAYSNWFGPIEAWAKANGYVTGNESIPTETDNCSDIVKPAPTISITSPGDSDNVESPLKINMNVEAAAGVDSVTVTVDGTSYQASKMSNGNGYTATVPLTEGEHTIYALVKDQKSKTAKSNVITVTVQPQL
ncbi:penicillin-binding protein [candidate division WS5 bacterium]|uniref:Penicillin-binding protein n=1 Tax=candidate division WS5 bacterium TaxID=2093353 RepID=A0A419DAF3_9BACT|nr:MAG: penicillin-binding protein [candidate division WS5 bacterium]